MNPIARFVLSLIASHIVGRFARYLVMRLFGYPGIGDWKVRFQPAHNEAEKAHVEDLKRWNVV